jgi:hypothetical protein
MKTVTRIGRGGCGYTHRRNKFEFEDIIEEKLWKNRNARFVFAVPKKETYELESLSEIGREYSKINQDFNSCVKFYSNQEDIKKIDYKEKINIFKIDLELILFYLQEAYKINEKSFIDEMGGGVITSSYIFSPTYESEEFQELKKEGFSLPCLEVLELKSKHIEFVKTAADLISYFYNQRGWNSFIFEGTLYDRKKVAFFSESRFTNELLYDKEMTPKTLTIYNPKELLYIANKNL